jgi:two-component system chemotaxis response regulator CheY
MPILIVDDYPVMRRVLRHLLDRLRFEQVDEASGAAEAMQKLRNRSYGLLMSDWNMDPMTGLDLLQAVRADAALASLPVILFTASEGAEYASKAAAAGASGFLTKPFTDKLLLATIETACSGRDRRAA